MGKVTEKRRKQLAKANRLYYARRRLRLIRSLGSYCVYCLVNRGTRVADHSDAGALCDVLDKLHFDHKNGDRDWSMTKLSQIQRLVIMEREAAEGRIQLLCCSCNSRKQDSRHESQEVPF